MDMKDVILSLLMESSTITEKFIELTLSRLKSLTYTVKNDDAFTLSFLLQKVENTIRNSCNTTSIPDGLVFIAVDMVCGEFLMNLKQTNSLGDSFNAEMAIKQVKLGDADVSFDDENENKKLDELFSYMMNHGKGEFICYRKIRW
ncbi:hypothetical protein [Longicatena caecimuris]|uniref:hypothetical protein n=1 Tax=Longicatena caecimuris TaxID=1796635 RepID=UPI003AB590F0